MQWNANWGSSELAMARPFPADETRFHPRQIALAANMVNSTMPALPIVSTRRMGNGKCQNQPGSNVRATSDSASASKKKKSEAVNDSRMTHGLRATRPYQVFGFMFAQLMKCVLQIVRSAKAKARSSETCGMDKA